MDKLDRKDIKKKSHNNIRNNYFMSILIVFIVSLIFNNNYFYSTKLISNNEEAIEIHSIIYDKNDNSIDVCRLNEENKKENNEEIKGVLAPLVGRLGISISPLYNFSYGINILVYDKNIGKGIFSLFVALISFLIYFFIKLIVEIGRNRFFLESRIYKKTNIMRLLFPYKIRGTFHLSSIMFLERLFSFLWSITIIGGFIKLYEYKMIPFILVENPKVSRKEVFDYLKN